MYGLEIPEILLMILAMVVPGLVGAVLARGKGRNAAGWFLLSALFWFPILVIILMPPAGEVPGKYRECPACREIIKWNAVKCKHCQSDLPPPTGG